MILPTGVGSCCLLQQAEKDWPKKKKKKSKEEQNLDDYSRGSNIKNCFILGIFHCIVLFMYMFKLSDKLLPTLIIILKSYYNKYWPKVTLAMIGWGIEEQWVSGPYKLSLSILKK